MTSESERRYPRFSRRLQAAILDGVLLSIAFVFSSVFIGGFDLPTSVKIAFVAFVILFLEPGLVSLTGSTVGHYLRGLKVEDVGTNDKINFVRATVRFVVKCALGLYSLIAILITQKRQAVHDLSAKSVVVLRHPDNFAPESQLRERDTPDPRFEIPSRLRRAFIVLLYIILLFTVLGLAIFLLLSDNCTLNNVCSDSEKIADAILTITWFLAFVAVIYLGANSRLWGARKRVRDQSN